MTFDHCSESPRSPNLPSHLNRLNISIPHQQQQQYPQHQYKDNQHCSPSAARPEQNQQSYQTQVFQNHISSLSPQLREQIQQHQLKQLLLKDQMQGKGSPVQANVVPLYVNTESRKPGEFVKQPILEYILSLQRVHSIPSWCTCLRIVLYLPILFMHLNVISPILYIYINLLG